MDMRMRFKSYQINHNQEPLPHATFAIDGEDSEGNIITYRFNELSNDWAASEFKNKIRELQEMGLQHYIGEDIDK